MLRFAAQKKSWLTEEKTLASGSITSTKLSVSVMLKNASARLKCSKCFCTPKMLEMLLCTYNAKKKCWHNLLSPI